MPEIPKTMKAAVLHAPHDLRLEEVPVPEVRDDAVLLRIRACAVCGTDTQIYKGADPRPLPCILGHEASGEVVAVGRRVAGIGIGDRLTFWVSFGCFAEYASILPATLAIGHLADHVNWEQGANTQLLCACLRGVDRAGIQQGQKVVVLGQGPVGLLVLQAAKACGAAAVVGVDLFGVRLAMSRRVGAALALNGRDESWPDRVREEIGEADVVLDCMNDDLTAGKRGLELAFRTLRATGRCVILSLADELRGPAPQQIVHKCITVCPSYVPLDRSRELMHMACDLVATGAVDVDSFVTHRIPLAQVAEGIELSRTHPDEAVKIMVRVPE